MRRLLCAVAASALAVSAVVLTGPGLASASAISECTSSRGTLVAVDYAHWNGPVVRGCDTSDPNTGIALLDDVGFATTGTAHDGPDFVCRIGNQAFEHGTQYPTPAQDPCYNTPPASAYWSYWLAPAGQNHWSYSHFGAYSDKPAPGEVELWIFGGTRIQGSDGDPVNGFPLCTPASLRAGGSPAHCSAQPASGGSATPTTQPPKAPTKHRAVASGSTHGSEGNPAPGPGANSASQGAATVAAGPGGSSATSSTASAGRSAPPGSSGSAIGSASIHPPGSPAASAIAIDALPASTTTPSAGSAVPLVVGVSIAALLGLAGAVTFWRRRSADQE